MAIPAAVQNMTDEEYVREENKRRRKRKFDYLEKNTSAYARKHFMHKAYTPMDGMEEHQIEKKKVTETSVRPKL